MKKYLFIYITLFTNITFAQNFNGIESLLLASSDDKNILFSGYLNPVINSLNHSMSGGWAQGAKTHKKFGFDITLSASASFVPNEAEVFSTISFTSITATSETLPTALGGVTSESLTVSILGSGDLPDLSTSFNAPSGIKEELPFKSAVTAPNLQLGIGLPFKTDLVFRYLPEYSNKNTSVKLMGLGIKHDVLQYFGPIDKIPLNISVLFAKSDFKFIYNIQSNSSINGSGQKASLEIKNYTAQLLASLDFKLLTLYSSVGYSRGDSNVKLLGVYNLEYESTSSNQPYIIPIEDPVNLSFANNSISTTFGLSINITGVKTFVDYTLQDYKTLTAGVSVSIR